MKKLHRVLICLLVLLLAVLSAAAEIVEPIEAGIRTIQKYGTLLLTISGNSLLEMGYEYGDIAAVTIDGQTYDMPVVSSYNDVDSGSMLCRVVASDDPTESAVLLSINMGDLATELRIATKTTIEEAPGFRWDYNDGYD